MEEFWSRVKAIIKQQNTTQEWLASKTGMPFKTLQGQISKGFYPRVDQAQAIASALGTTVEYLVTGQAPEVTDPRIPAARRLSDELSRLFAE